MEESYYKPYFKLCKNEINHLSEANSNFFANIYIITKTIGIIMNTGAAFYGQLLPSVKIPYENIAIEEFNCI